MLCMLLRTRRSVLCRIARAAALGCELGLQGHTPAADAIMANAAVPGSEPRIGSVQIDHDKVQQYGVLQIAADQLWSCMMF